MYNGTSKLRKKFTIVLQTIINLENGGIRGIKFSRGLIDRGVRVAKCLVNVPLIFSSRQKFHEVWNLSRSTTLGVDTGEVARNLRDNCSGRS